MSRQAAVIPYRESELRFRNAWARRRRRESLRFATCSLLAPLASYPLGILLSLIDEASLATTPRFFLQTDNGAFALCSVTAVGIALAVKTLAHASDARIGRLPYSLGSIALLINGCILFLMLTVLAY